MKQTIVDLIDQGTRLNRRKKTNQFFFHQSYSFRLLQLDLIIRDKNLNVANPADTSTHDLLHSLMRIEKKSLHEVEKIFFLRLISSK